LPQKDARELRPDNTHEIEFREDSHYRLVESVNVTADGQSMRFKGNCEIGRKLPRQMECATTTAVNPMNPDAKRLKHVVIGDDMSPAARSSHADRRRVLTEHKRCSKPLAEVVGEPSLEPLDLLKVNQPEQVNFDGGGVGGWIHVHLSPQTKRVFGGIWLFASRFQNKLTLQP
jgi:hypothetical protein